MPFQKGNKLGPGRKKGSKNAQTLWVLESLKKEGVDYTKVLAKAITDRDIDLINALARLAPHIANRPKEHTTLEGIESLVIRELPNNEKIDSK
jgi:hypothetical protein